MSDGYRRFYRFAGNFGARSRRFCALARVPCRPFVQFYPKSRPYAYANVGGGGGGVRPRDGFLYVRMHTKGECSHDAAIMYRVCGNAGARDAGNNEETFGERASPLTQFSARLYHFFSDPTGAIFRTVQGISRGFRRGFLGPSGDPLVVVRARNDAFLERLRGK